jgi:hypothetical protein
MGRFFKLPKRCPYCAHKLNKFGQCKNPNCIIGYVPDKKKAMSMAATTTTTENANEERMESTERESMTTTTSEDA